MKKTVAIGLLLLIICGLFVGCHTHNWSEASCIKAKTCIDCDETEGEPLGHTWIDATCTTPKTCSRCGATEGEALGHEWRDATCTEAKTCSRCGVTEGGALGHEWKDATCTEAKICCRCEAVEGDALGHEWVDATCTEPKTCSRCGATEGEALGHDLTGVTCTESANCSRCGEEIPALGHEWVDATCTDAKTCSRCNVTEGEPLGHTAADPKKENKKAATCTEDGSYEEVVYCSVCHAELSRTTKTEAALGHSTTSGVCSRCGLELYEPITGRGDDVISNVTVGDGLYKAHITNSGSRNFIVWVYDKNEDRDLAVNEIGSFDGYYFLEGAAPYTFEVESSGNWSITIERIGTTTETSFSGKGSYVTDIFSASTGTWHITHSGSHNFVIWLYTTDGRDLIVNEIGKYDGRKRMAIPTGSNAFLVIEADGKWTIEPAD